MNHVPYYFGIYILRNSSMNHRRRRRFGLSLWTQVTGHRRLNGTEERSSCFYSATRRGRHNLGQPRDTTSSPLRRVYPNIFARFLSLVCGGEVIHSVTATGWRRVLLCTRI